VKDQAPQQIAMQTAKNLQNTSKDRTKRWPNTLDAVRIKREEDRIRRLEDEEIERRRVDAEEADYQDNLRNTQIAKTNNQMFQNQDQVKALRSKMMMCDVAHEQKAQRGLAGRKKEIQKQIDEQWVEMEKE
jgi:hypothetical protein